MKKVQRSFAVEYKSGRRKPDQKQNSIWGDVDLKSLARVVDEENATFHASPENRATEPFDNLYRKAADKMPASIKPEDLRPLTATATEETPMAEQLETNDSNAGETVADKPIETKKQRKPRTKKAIVAGEPVDTNTVEKKRRGRKPGTSKDAAASLRRAPAVQTPKPDPAGPVLSGDELEDLLQLEEENGRLRKLLAEKLQSENAELRKRLKLV